MGFKNLFRKRIKILQKNILKNDLTGVLLHYSRDIFYYTGTVQPSYFVVFPDEYFLFVKSGYSFALTETFIEKSKVLWEKRLDKIFQKISSFFTSKGKIGTELDVLSVNEFLKLKKVFEGFDFVDISPTILEQRKRKDQYEVEKLRKACKVVDVGHKAILQTLTEGITELKLAAAVENAVRLAGDEGMYFMRHPDFFMGRGPLTSGSNLFKISGVVSTISGVGLSPAIPAGPSRRKIKEGDLVVADMPALVEGYHADQTRTYVVGKASKNIRRMFEALKEISDHLIDSIEVGMKSFEVYRMALDKAEKLGIGKYFLNLGDERGKTFLVGHGIGLELNEPPILSCYEQSTIPDRLVITIEIHVMDKHTGVVKLEDMILVGKRKNKILNITPQELFEV